MKSHLTPRDIWEAWVLPAMTALIVAAVLVVERLQVDWTASCSMLAVDGCTAGPARDVFGWLPVPLAYGVVHIWGARRLIDARATVTRLLLRIIAISAFLALLLLPTPAFFPFYIGVAGGVAISLTVVGIAVAPIVGVLVAGFCSGVLLGALAGPWVSGLPWPGWKTLLWGYGLGGALGGAMLIAGQLLFDPQFANTFGANLPWLTAGGTLATVLAIGIVTSLLAQRGWVRAGLIPSSAATPSKYWAAPAALAALLVVTAHLMVTTETTLFRRDGAPVPAIASFVRGGKPGIASEVSLAGLVYVGPRASIVRREITKRSRIETTRIDRGPSGHVNVGETVYDSFEQWDLSDPAHPDAEIITLTADKSALTAAYECEPGLTPEQEFCIRPEPVYRDHLKKTFAIAYAEDAFLVSAASPAAALGIQFDRRKARAPDKRSWARLYCRLNLTSVTPAQLSVMQIVPCDADWVMQANQLRARLERDFLTKPAS